MQKTPKAVLFDADGVTIIPKHPFSVQYANAHGLDAKELGAFFDKRFSDVLTGKRDLKELLEERRELWQWKGSVEDLMKQWFNSENHVNKELILFIQQVRAKGIKCYLTMNQEKYRTEYIKEKMFPGVFDKIFSSSDMGIKKPDPKYYQYVIDELCSNHLIFYPNDLLYLDDSVSNVESAQNLGIRSFLYTNVLQVKKLLPL